MIGPGSCYEFRAVELFGGWLALRVIYGRCCTIMMMAIVIL